MGDKAAQNAVIGAVASAAIGFAIWHFGFSGGDPSPKIDGPSTVFVQKVAALPGVISPTFYLKGYPDGGYRQMYWTDTFGTSVPFLGAGIDEAFRCPDVGTFTVTLTEVSREGHRGQTAHTIDCMIR